MTRRKPKKRARKWHLSHHDVMRIAVLMGIILGLTCHFMPRDYRVACKMLASLCSGG